MLVDRVGPRRVVLGGVVLLGSAPLLNATVHAPWHLYLYTGVLGAIGLVGLGWVPMGVLLSQWFVERRGRAVGVAFSGMGVGEIGRASCRERGESWVGGVALKKKSQWERLAGWRRDGDV